MTTLLVTLPSAVPRHTTLQNAAAQLTKNGQPLLSGQQINDLLLLQYSSGQSVFNDETKDLFYQVMAWIYQYDYDQVYTWLEQAISTNERKIVFNSPFMAENMAAVKRADEALYLKNEPLETDEACPRCGATNVTMTEKQTRKADEAMTIFLTCNECGKNWKS